MSAAVQYADSDGTYVAYQAIGEGPRDVIVVMDGFVPIDTMDDEPRLARSMQRLGSLGRLIRFDRRGVGLSDPVSPRDPPTLEQWVDDAVAVLDAVGSEQAVVVTACEMSPMGLLLAAMHPDRVESLVVVNGFARAIEDEGYPHGITADAAAELIASMTTVNARDDTDDFALVAVPSAANDPHFLRWWKETGRRGASPALAQALMRVQIQSDVRSVLPTIQAPTLVVFMQDEPFVPVAAGRHVADHVPGAEWVIVPGADDFWWASDHARDVLDAIEEFLTGTLGPPATNRVLSTVMITDIVSSTERANELGDQRWTELLDRHDAAVRRQLTRFRGTEVNTTGDGFLATFDGPARAVACARAIRDATQQLGIEVRTGIHTGEIELRGDDVAGVGVHIAARVAALAEPSGIWVSRTVTDLVIGSGIAFAERGDHALKGVPGTWSLFAVVDD